MTVWTVNFDKIIRCVNQIPPIDFDYKTCMTISQGVILKNGYIVSTIVDTQMQNILYTRISFILIIRLSRYLASYYHFNNSQVMLAILYG